MKRWHVIGATILVHAIAFSSVASAQDRLDHPGAGIGMNRPVAWHDATLAQVQANRDRVRLSDPELQQGLRTRSAMPLFVFTKYAEPHAGLNPSIQVTLRPALAGTPTDLLAGAVETLSRAFADYQIVSPIRPAQVDGWPAAHIRVAYTLENQAGERFPVLSRLWLVPRGRLMFLIGMSGGQTGADVCEDEFAGVLASVTIQK